MRVKRFVATNIEEAMSKIKREMGPNAVILHTRYFKEGGFLGLFKRSYVEVTAATEEDNRPTLKLNQTGPDLLDVQAVKQQILAAQSNLTPAEEAVNQPPEFTAPYAANPVAFQVASSEQNIPLQNKVPRNVPKQVPNNELKLEHPDLSQELLQMKNMMTEMTRILEESSTIPNFPKIGKELYLRLRKQEVEDRLAKRIVRNTLQQLEMEAEEQDERLEDIFLSNILKPLKKGKPIQIGKTPLKKPKVFALVGPTGVGKTTTIAKLAAMFSVIEQKKVAFVTVDTYRIAAVEQLKTIAEIMNVPVKVVYSVEQMQKSLLELVDRELIFIDTAGRSHKNEQQLDELKEYLEAARPDETFLVMSSTGKYQDMLDILKAYEDCGITRLIFTKVDETSFYGAIYNIACRSKIPLAYLTTGQEIPDDIEAIDPMKLARLLLKEQ